MKTMKRNQTTIYYAQYLSTSNSVIEDEYGNPLETGEKNTSHTEPIAIDLVVSPATGIVAEELFGGLQDYDRVLITEKDCEINEHSILWIEASTDAPHDYIVKRVARSLNFVAYAVSKVEVSYGDSN